MTDLPPPLTPPECSMAGNDWYPLYFRRLRNSKWWRRASDVARARNVMLWGEAYQAVPAGSLPDDDDELAEAAGFGMDVEAFLAVKREIMRPWVKCADGRWYHPAVCEVALESWERQTVNRKAEAARKAGYRRRVRERLAVSGSPPPVLRDSAACPAGQGRESHGTRPEVPRDMGHTDKTDRTDTSVDKSASAGVRKRADYPDLFIKAWRAYPHFRGRSSKPRSFDEWGRLSSEERGRLAPACDRYAHEGGEARAKCGAPGMHRWLHDQRFEDWMAPSVEERPVDYATWATRIAHWRATGDWRVAWGVAPGEPGCLAPSVLLERAA